MASRSWPRLLAGPGHDLEEAEALDVAVRPGLNAGDHVVATDRGEEMGKPTLALEVGLDGHAAADRRHRGHVSVRAFEDGKQPCLGGQPGDENRLRRGRAPAERTGDEDMD